MILKVINDKGNVEYISGEKITLPDKFVRAYLMDNNGKTIETINGNNIALDVLIETLFSVDNSIETILDAWYKADGTIYDIFQYLKEKHPDEFLDDITDYYTYEELYGA